MSTASDYICLGWSDIVPDRSFTNPDHNVEDIATLEYMVRRLCKLLNQPGAVLPQPRPYVVYLEEANGHTHRVAIANPTELLTCSELAVVGFCGHKWPEADRTELEIIDRELIDEFLQHPYLLSYSSLQLESGDWRNLVLFSHPQGIGHWAVSSLHAYAARDLAPGYYQNIRLHNGLLPGGLMAGNPLILNRTKYYDYQDQTLWWAVRELGEGHH